LHKNKVAQSTVYKLLNECKLPGRKVGGSWRFSKRTLDEWIEGDMHILKGEQFNNAAKEEKEPLEERSE
jgi:excisionase family DNA binding protein